MAKANGYGDGPTLSRMVPNGPEWSQMVQGLRTKGKGERTKDKGLRTKDFGLWTKD